MSLLMEYSGSTPFYHPIDIPKFLGNFVDLPIFINTDSDRLLGPLI